MVFEAGESVFLARSRVFVVVVISPKSFGYGSREEEWTQTQPRWKQEAGINKVTCVTRRIEHACLPFDGFRL